MNAPHRRKEWLEFKDWCAQRKLKAFPAHPWTVATYCLWLDANRRYRTLHKRVDIIARVHVRACKHAPDQAELVRRTLETIDQRRQTPPEKSFDGLDLLMPKKTTVQPPVPEVRKTMRRQPPLVSPRPELEG